MKNYKLLSSDVVSDIWCKRKARGFDPLDGKEILILLKYFSRTWDDPSCFSLLAGGIFPLTREEAERMIEYYYENKKLYHKGG